MIALKRILVATDFSEASAAAVRYGRALAESFGASLDVLHVMEDPFLYAPTSEGFAPPQEYFESLEQQTRENLEQTVAPADRAKLNARLVLKRGTPFVEIIRYAKSEAVDLIVLGTHGRGPIAHMLMGSVAERVVRKAPCPVLTVRHPEHEFVMP
jgi:nucleotide-binding universal stress UspA family protein